MPSLSTTVCGLKLKNPFIVASGIMGGSASTIRRLETLGAGAVVTKTITIKEREGYPGPTVVEISNDILLNAMGLPNPGVKKFKKELEDLELTIPLIVSISEESPEEFVKLAKNLTPLASALELNLSCPHPEPKGKKKILIAQDKEMTYQVVKKVKEEIQEIPIFVKLSPSVTDIKEIVHASLLAGADGITLINTVPALDIDLNFERPVLGNLIGGQSGHSILCIAQRKVAEAKSELLQWEREKGRKVHLIGCGGISTGYDAVKFHLIGVDAVQIGTVLKNDLDVIERMKKEMEQFMSLKGYNSIQDFQGKAFKYLENVV